MSSFFSTLFAPFTRGDPSTTETMAPREPLPTLPTSSPSSLTSSWPSDGYRQATTLLRSGSVDSYISQHALYPSSSWWLR